MQETYPLKAGEASALQFFALTRIFPGWTRTELETMDPQDRADAMTLFEAWSQAKADAEAAAVAAAKAGK